MVWHAAYRGDSFSLRRTPRRTDSSVQAAILTAWDGLSKIPPANEICVVSRPAPRDPPPFITLTSLT